MTDNPTVSIADQLALTTMDRDSWQKLADLVRGRAEKAEAKRDRLAAELEENVGVLKALRRQRDQAEAERDRLRTGMDDLFTRWFLNAHAGLGFREAMMGIAADLRAVLDGAPCPGEGQGCNCSCEGCKHHCAAHQPPVTSHTYEGETRGAAREQHEMRDCPHPDTWFDRTVCPEPCGAMHDRCSTCGDTVNPCALDTRTTLDNPLTSTNTVDNPKEQP